MSRSRTSWIAITLPLLMAINGGCGGVEDMTLDGETGKAEAAETTGQVVWMQSELTTEMDGQRSTFKTSKENLAHGSVIKRGDNVSVHLGNSSRCPPYIGELAEAYEFELKDSAGSTTRVTIDAGRTVRVWGTCGEVDQLIELSFSIEGVDGVRMKATAPKQPEMAEAEELELLAELIPDAVQRDDETVFQEAGFDMLLNFGKGSLEYMKKFGMAGRTLEIEGKLYFTLDNEGKLYLNTKTAAILLEVSEIDPEVLVVSGYDHGDPEEMVVWGQFSKGVFK